MHDKKHDNPGPDFSGQGQACGSGEAGISGGSRLPGSSRGSTRFTIAYYINGRRERRTFGSLDAAKEEARMVALNIQRA